MTFTILQSVYKKDNPDFLSESLQSIAENTLPPTSIVLVKDGELTSELDSEKFFYKENRDCFVKYYADKNNSMYYKQIADFVYADKQGASVNG